MDKCEWCDAELKLEEEKRESLCGCCTYVYELERAGDIT